MLLCVMLLDGSIFFYHEPLEFSPLKKRGAKPIPNSSEIYIYMKGVSENLAVVSVCYDKMYMHITGGILSYNLCSIIIRLIIGEHILSF